MKGSGLRCRRFATVAFLCITLAGQGLAHGFDPGSISWRSLGLGQGFTGGSVSSIIQDRRGLIWIGAAGGLYRYDGSGFKVFKPDPGINSLVSSSISALIEDKNGNLWVGSDGGGLARYDVFADRFEKISLPDGIAEGKASRISALATDSLGRILIGTADGAVREASPEGGKATEFIHPGQLGASISALFVDSKGRIWVGTDGGGLDAFDVEGKSVASYRHDQTEATSIASDKVSAIIEDSLGFIWVGFSDGGIDLFEEGRFTHSKREGQETGRLPSVLSLAEDVRGRIWAGFLGGNLGILDPSSMETFVAPFADGVDALVLFHDRRGLMWVGLGRGGLLTGDLRSAAFSRFSSSREASILGTVQAVAKSPSGALMVASRSAGLLAFDPLSDSFSHLKLDADNVNFGEVQTMVASGDGSLWIGTSGSGLLRRSPDGSIEHFVHREKDPESLASSSILSLLEDEDGKYWVGMDGDGLDLFNPANGKAIHWGNRGNDSPLLPASIVTCLARDSVGHVWAGTADAGLFVLDPGGSHFRPLGRDERRGGGIGDLRIECLFEDSRGVLWVGTGGGILAALDMGTGAVIHRYAGTGRIADAIYGMAEDNGGTLWILSSEGLFSLDPERKDIFLFGVEDGLNGGGLEAGAILAAKDGNVWVGSGGGLTRFDPSHVARYAPAPDVVISDLEPMGESSSFGRSSFGRSLDGTAIDLDYDNRGLGFSIAAIDFAAPSRNRYAMRLEGRQPAWTSMGKINTGYIAPLAPGRYMLRVRAANGNGIWNDYGASLSIVVRPPWWGTWWFRTLVLGLAAAGLAAAIAARVESLRRRNALLVKFAHHIEEARDEERTIAARDVHDEIGQHLMVLNFHAYWLASHAEAKADERLPVVREMQKAILDSMASVKAVATRLRPSTLDTLDFPDAMRWYAKSFGRMSGIETRLEMGEGWKELPKDAAKTFFRLLQEMLSNVARHSGAGHVIVRFVADEDGFLLETKDDGVGIGAGKVDAQDSFGIIGMRESCAALGGILAISGAPGEGCTVSARLPRTRKSERKKRREGRC